MGLTADRIVQKERSKNLKTKHQKLSKIKHGVGGGGQNFKNTYNGIRELWDNFSQPNIDVPERGVGEAEKST